MRGKILIAAAAAALVAAACGSGGDGARYDGGGADRGTVAGVDLSRHSVPLADVHFDTFDGGSVPLSEIGGDLILSLVDAIPPIDEPRYEDASGGDWLEGDDLVIGYVGANGDAWAFPVKILNFHEIVNDELDGTPVLISYCPLCRSAIAYDRRLDGRELTFGNSSALYESDLVMFDRETSSYWWQVAGEAIVGTLTGARLTTLPSTTVTWAQWLQDHPDTMVLSRETGFARSYERDVFAGYRDQVNDERFAFPVSADALDGRLAPGDEVLGLTVGGDSRAYSARGLGNAAVNDSLGGEEIVVFSTEDGPTAAAYLADAGDETLSFSYADGQYRDAQTGSTWNLSGEAVSGPLQGTTLEPLPSRYTFWFAYIAAFPDADVYAP